MRSSFTRTAASPESQAESYWDRYYRDQPVPDYPTQFAAFILSAAGAPRFLVDCGCGNGRDSLFFAQHHKTVIGLDASAAAIALCCARAAQSGLQTASFTQFDIAGRADVDIAARHILARHILAQAAGAPILIYARFLLHVLDEPGQAAFLAFARALCATTSAGSGLLAVEFRTHHDQPRAKATAAHYRRFIDPADFIAAADQLGFHPIYQTQGLGYARYQNEDAHVYRGLLVAKS